MLDEQTLPHLADSPEEHAIVAPQSTAEFLSNVPVFAPLSEAMRAEIAELGRAAKAIFLCRYLHSEALRREINEGLNVVEH